HERAITQSRKRRVHHRLRRETADGAEVECEIASGLKALLGTLLQAMPHDALESLGHADVELDEIRRIFFEDRVQRFDRCVAAERLTSGQHLVEDRAERENVGALIAAESADLFGRDVADGAEQTPR